ncbi:hypothetical protein B0H19DRAFT_1270800 [Mycena capillaripes]|nr:hypothetical protein B0H19DRAFT_1270800 [Mycena capillaripes]
MGDTRGPPAFGIIDVVRLPSVSQHLLFHRSMITGKSSIRMRISRLTSTLSWTIWTAPLQVTIYLLILLTQLGPSALAGFSLFLFIVPIQEHIMAVQLKTSGKSMKFTDLRARILLEEFTTSAPTNIAVAFSLPILTSTGNDTAMGISRESTNLQGRRFQLISQRHPQRHGAMELPGFDQRVSSSPVPTHRAATANALPSGLSVQRVNHERKTAEDQKLKFYRQPSSNTTESRSVNFSAYRAQTLTAIRTTADDTGSPALPLLPARDIGRSPSHPHASA